MSENKQNVPKLRFPGFTDAWEQRKLGEVVDFLDERRRPLESGLRKVGPYPYYGASGIIDYVNDYIFDEELILLSEDGANIIDRNYRVCFMARGKYWVNNHAHVLKAKNNYYNEFICEALERLDYTKYNTGTAQPKLNQEVCRNINILIPNFDEQIQISTFFTNLDKLITLHQRKLNNLKNLKNGLLQKMFPKNGEKFPEVRFPRFTLAWEQRKLGDCTTLITKGTTPMDKSGAGEINFIKVENIANGKIVPISKITEEEHNNYLKRSRLEDHDILFSIAGTLGRTAIVDKSILPANTNQALAIIRGYDFNTDFLITSLGARVVDEYIRKNPTVGAQPNLSLEQIGNLVIYAPNKDEQIQISTFFTNLDKLITLHQRKLEHLQKQKKALLQQMFI